MPYQPNPFVNPNQRGVELPAGCKDLIDVLKRTLGKERSCEDRIGPEMVRLGDIEARVTEILERKRTPRLFAVMWHHVFLSVDVRGHGPRLKLRVYDDEISVKRTLRRVFGNPALCREMEEEQEFLSIPMTGGPTEIASIVTQLLEDGYGVTAAESLQFFGWVSGEQERLG